MEVGKKERGGKARLWRALFKCIWHRLLIQGVLMFIEVSGLCMELSLPKVKCMVCLSVGGPPSWSVSGSRLPGKLLYH